MAEQGRRGPPLLVSDRRGNDNASVDCLSLCRESCVFFLRNYHSIRAQRVNGEETSYRIRNPIMPANDFFNELRGEQVRVEVLPWDNGTNVAFPPHASSVMPVTMFPLMQGEQGIKLIFWSYRANFRLPLKSPAALLTGCLRPAFAEKMYTTW